MLIRSSGQLWFKKLKELIKRVRVGLILGDLGGLKCWRGIF